MSALPGTTGRRRIYLMRHGHVDYFGPEIRAAGGDPKVVPLTPLGQEQAKAAGQALAHVALDRAICSGVPRTRQTAEFVLAAQEGNVPPLEVEPDLVEIHGGSFGHVMSRTELAANRGRRKGAGEVTASGTRGERAIGGSGRRLYWRARKRST